MAPESNSEVTFNCFLQEVIYIGLHSVGSILQCYTTAKKQLPHPLHLQISRDEAMGHRLADAFGVTCQ
jgi:hypothetical protein